MPIGFLTQAGWQYTVGNILNIPATEITTALLSATSIFLLGFFILYLALGMIAKENKKLAGVISGLLSLVLFFYSLYAGWWAWVAQFGMGIILAVIVLVFILVLVIGFFRSGKHIYKEARAGIKEIGKMRAESREEALGELDKVMSELYQYIFTAEGTLGKVKGDLDNLPNPNDKTAIIKVINEHKGGLLQMRALFYKAYYYEKRARRILKKLLTRKEYKLIKGMADTSAKILSEIDNLLRASDIHTAVTAINSITADLKDMQELTKVEYKKVKRTTKYVGKSQKKVTKP